MQNLRKCSLPLRGTSIFALKKEPSTIPVVGCGHWAGMHPQALGHWGRRHIHFETLQEDFFTEE